MKNLIVILLAMFAFIPAGAIEREGGGKIQFVTKVHDFGYVKEDNGNVTCNFEFKNVGDKPLIIIAARASCGCTKPSYPKKPIAPGETGEITVTYSPAGREGAFDKAVSVKTNAGTVHLRIKGTVIP